jgi:hypothetical protein
MSNLLAIEAAFLSNPQVKAGLNLQEVTALQRAMGKTEKKTFEQSLQLSTLAASAWAWVNSEEGKALCEEEGVTFTRETLGQKVFGREKSFFCKLIKAGNLSTEVVTTYQAKCDEAEAANQKPVRSIESLLKFAKAVEQGTDSGGTGEEGESEGESEEAAIEVRAENMFTFTFKNPEGNNVAVRIDTEGNVKSTNPYDEVLEAIRLFTTKYKYPNNANTNA